MQLEQNDPLSEAREGGVASGEGGFAPGVRGKDGVRYANGSTNF